ANQFTIFNQKFHNSVNKSIRKFKGRIVLLNNNSYLVSFESVTNAVLCALKIQSNFKYITPKFDSFLRRLKIGISVGAPVSSKQQLFQEAVDLSKHMCEVVQDQLVISSEVKAIYDRENDNAFLSREQVRILKPREEKFLIQLMDFIDSRWNDPQLTVEDFSQSLGYSRSQVYRKLMNLTGKSPNVFLREFRLHRALKMLFEQKGNISEVAFESGFNSPTYFSKCFFEKYNIPPSKYLQQHVN
ncbi:MAG: AraC family transcriptional regulator, partial [Bacteroidia bacterium]|nr:AraC family transcriptional regulator [Bacteroidia bacterium]